MNNFLLSVAALFTATAFAIFSVVPEFAAADDYGSGGMQPKMAENMPMGTHSMGGTIESIDHKTGWMKLKTGMGDMTIHYPPQTVKDLNAGDKITANLSYTKDDGKIKDGGMMKMK